LQVPRHPQASAPGIPAWFWSVVALALGTALTLWAAGRQQASADLERQAAFATLAQESFDAIAADLHACELLLRSVQTVFLASDEITPAEFGNLYDNLRPRVEFASLQALAYARREPGPHRDHYVTSLVQPLAGNERVVGLDIVAQPHNLAAVLASRDSDRVAMSAPFRLVQVASSRAGDTGNGLTMRLPVYSPGAPPRTLAERRARMRGSIAASFLARRLIADAIPAGNLDRIRVTVTDESAGGQVLYASPGGGESAGQEIERMLAFGGREWRVAMRPRQQVAGALGWSQSLLWPGLIASTLLALLVWSVANTRRRALELGWRMSHRFRESEQRFRVLNDLLPALVLLARPEDGRIIYANQAACARLGGRIEQGISLDSLFEDPALRQRLRQQAAESAAAPGSMPEGWDNLEAVLVSLGGDRFWVATSIARIRIGDEERMLMVASDISEQRQLTELLGHQASHDNRTELYNRREFERHVRRALQAIVPGAPARALLYIDLDQFKLINDTSGHLAGDQLLSQLALVMSDLVRPGDVLARLGGDEFGVLVQQAGEGEALALAERLRQRIEGHIYIWEHRSYTISASIGMVMLDQPGMTLREVLAQADTACYVAKDHGRNRIHVFSGQDVETIRRRGEMEWANRLRWVIEEDRLLLDYQEVQPLQPGPPRDPHIELLLRLRDEDGRIAVPGAFLPAAERYGLVPQLDRWVIAEAISHFDRLHASGRTPGRCSLNLSAATLEDESLGDYILGLIRQYGVAPERLCFEITETEAVRNLARAVRFIERLRAVGCQVALDDFGAGMSSFGYLKNLPVDVIKIDGSFIRDVEVDPMSRSIVDAITEIGHQRGLEVVAEWVDSERLVEILRALGVDYGQGYALHRPEPVLYQRAARGRAS
jgi:diguanylate cyclase (GGDEF)-like protein/PAS domain S-box-containing protein